MTRIFLTSVLLLTANSAQADESILATLYATSGSLPPPYAWSVSVTIATDGLVTAKRCKGYETEGLACKTGTAIATPEALEAIRIAAKASDLATRPALALDPPMVGGASLSGTVILDEQAIEMIDQPVPQDAERVSTLIEIVGGAIPIALDPILSGE